MGLVNDVKQFGNNRRTHAPYLSFPPIGSLLNLTPVFTSGATADFNENATGTVLTVAATPSGCAYSIKAGGDGDSFNLDANTGVLTFKSPPDYETKNSYSLTIIATKGSKSTEQNITITILNVIEAPGVTSPTSADLADTSATVGATLDCKGLSTVWSIEYGKTNAYGSTQAGETTTSNGAKTVGLTGLDQNTKYYWRFKAVNSDGTTYSDEQNLTTTNVRWILPVAGQTSGTATAGTLVFTCSEDITPTVMGDVTISVARANDPDASLRKHTLTVNCPNNGSGAIIIPDRSKVLSCGGHNGTSFPITSFYSGTNTTAPKLTWNLDDLPSTVVKIRQSTEYTTILPTTGSNALPTGITYLYLNGNNINWTYNGALPTGITYLLLSGTNINWTYNGALPTGITSLHLSGTNINWTYNGALPTGLTYLYLTGSNIGWSGLNVGNNGNITFFNLANYRTDKMSSTDMVTLLTQLTNRTGTLPSTIIINDYADYASPPTAVTDAVAALKTAKSITTVNLGA